MLVFIKVHINNQMLMYVKCIFHEISLISDILGNKITFLKVSYFSFFLSYNMENGYLN